MRPSISRMPARCAAFITHDDHVALFDFSIYGGIHRFFFTIENARRAAMIGSFVAGSFHDAAIGRERAAQNHEAARSFDWIGNRAHHVLARKFFHRERFLVQRF